MTSYRLHQSAVALVLFCIYTGTSGQTCPQPCTANQYCAQNATGFQYCQACNLACNGCTGGSVTDCKACAANYYNSTDRGCLGCNSACNGCTGPGPGQCKRCAPGFFNSSGICRGCPLNFFGENCTGNCHCLNNSDCRPADGFCTSWTCDWGWSVPPSCQTPCTSEQFGKNCLYTCHCPENDTCSQINGLCSSGKCHPQYGGAGCQILLPKLRTHPDVTDNKCGNVTVSWSKWVKDEDIGVGPIGSYTLQILQVNISDLWNDVITRTDINTSRFTYIFTDLDPTGTYLFRVNIRRMDGDKLSSEWTTGNPTENVTTSCIDDDTDGVTVQDQTRVTTTVGTTPVPITPMPTPPAGSLFKNFEVRGEGTNSVIVLWEKKDLGEILGNATLTYQTVAIGDCEVIGNPIETQLDVSGTGNVSLQLTPFRNYTVTVALDTPYHNVSDSDRMISRIFSTGETAPTGTVQSFSILYINSSSVTIGFSAPFCRERGGRLLYYEYSLVNRANLSVTLINGTTRATFVQIDALLPYTSYVIFVTYVNSAASGPKAGFEFITSEGVPTPPLIRDMVADIISIQVFLQPPSLANGIVRIYEVQYSLTANFRDNTPKITNTTSTLISGLKAYTTYFFRARAQTLPGLISAYSPVNQTQTKEDFPGAPASLSLTAFNESCLSVAWTAPAEVRGVIQSYRIRYSTDDNPQDQQSTLIESSTTFNHDVCGLQPWTLYVIDLSASTARGFGPSTVAFQKTYQSVPANPPAPVYKNNTEETIMIEIYPVKLTTGPVSQYVVYVNDVTKAKVRRRRQTNAGIPPGTAVASFGDADVTTSKLFTVGDGNSYGGFSNPPLQKDHTYDIYLQIVSTVKNISKYSFSKLANVQTSLKEPTTTKPGPIVVPPDDNNGTVIIILIVIIIIIILVIIAVIILVIWYRRRGQFSPSRYELQVDDVKMNAVFDDYDPHRFWNTIHSTRESRFIIAGRELIPDDGFHSDQNSLEKRIDPPVSFQQEFHELPHEPQATWNEATRAANVGKNRFRYLLPYDLTRVILDPDENSNSDYINASFVKGYHNKHAYIAAQSPFDEETVLDFWRMIYQYNIKVVVMITNIIEDKIVKCTQYWPGTESEKVKYGAFTLKTIELREYADYVIRTIKIKVRHDTGAPKIVHLFEFCSWPDHGVPDDPIPLLEFRHKVREYHGKGHSPLLVHCGTGVSRTGTYIAIDSLLEQYENEGRISVFAFVRRMRKDRIAMVRTVKQYIFIYEAIFEARVAGDTRAGLDLKQRYHTLTMRNRKTKHSFLKDQFVSLQRYTRKYPSSLYTDAISNLNFDKNRFPDVVPPNHYRPILKTPGGLDRTDYINAVFLNSHLERDHFILTQTPMHTTIIDFWKLVYDHDVSTIVMMEDFKHEDDTCAEYWPENKIKKFEPFFVDNTNIWQQENVTIRHFKIHNMLHPKDTPREVRQFQFNAWDDADFIPKSKSMILDLIDLVRSWQDQSNEDMSPILVHCKDGATHSGLFCAVWNICETMREDHDIDLYHVVKHMKRRRSQIVDTLDQYRFCYKVLWDYMNLRMPGGTLTNQMNHTQQDRLNNVGSLSLASYASHLDYV